MTDAEIMEHIDRRFESIGIKLDKIVEMHAQRSLHVKIAVFFGVAQACIDMFLLGFIIPATRPLFDFFKR